MRNLTARESAPVVGSNRCEPESYSERWPPRPRSAHRDGL